MRTNVGHSLDDKWLTILSGFDVSLGSWFVDVECDVTVDGFRKGQAKGHADGPMEVKGERE